MTDPVVSVCIPTYCRHELLGRALKSVLAQDFQPVEIIISDNFSEDGSWEWTAKLGDLDPRIIVRRNERNLGWTGNLNECVKTARGKYITFLCDDDELLPGMIRTLYEFMESHPYSGLVHVPAYYIGLTGKAKPVVPRIKPLLKAGLEALTHTAFEFNIVFSSVMVRLECFKKLGGFLESMSSDYEMWSRIAAKYDVGYISNPLVRVYVHSISPKMTPGKYISESERLGEMVIKLFPENFRNSEEMKCKGKKQMVAAMRSLGIQSMQAGYLANAFAFLRSARAYSADYGLLKYAVDILFRAVPRRLYYLLKRKKTFNTHV